MLRTTTRQLLVHGRPALVAYTGAGAWGNHPRPFSNTLRCLSSSSSSSSSGTSRQQGSRHNSSSSSSAWGRGSAVFAAAAGLLYTTAAGTASADSKQQSVAPKVAAKVAQQQQGKPTGAAAADAQGHFPEYTADEVAQHKTPQDRVWVTYKDGVYDITDFIAQHPGGAAKIMLAAGGSVEPFWGLYQQHQKPEILEIISKYRIGTLKGAPRASTAVPQDPYKNEPSRHPALMVRSQKPFNGETPPELLTAAPITPVDVFFVRHHLPVPEVAADNYSLTVEGAGMRSLQLSLPQLQQQFKKVEIPATIECAGNRRAEMKAEPAPGGGGHTIKGLDWDAGAISTAVWGGVHLRDVLQAAGLRLDDPSVAHIHFYGHDKDESGTAYAASIPISKAMSAQGDVLLAWEMNGQPLPRDHGGPLRVIVPGTTGARSVKWLDRVVASADECQGHWQQKDYKSFSPGTDWDNLDWSTAPAIQEMPVVSAICEPTQQQEFSKYDGEISVKGYAWSGGGRDIVRVDVSSDGGKTWTPAQLIKVPHSKPDRAWAWTLWEVTLPLPEGHTGPVELACKATDAAYNTQPETTSSVWNIRGLCNNAWHKVTVKVTDE